MTIIPRVYTYYCYSWTGIYIFKLNIKKDKILSMEVHDMYQPKQSTPGRM